jgi:hypothetical protein
LSKKSNLITYNSTKLSDRDLIVITDTDNICLKIVESDHNKINEIILNASECRNLHELITDFFRCLK